MEYVNLLSYLAALALVLALAAAALLVKRFTTNPAGFRQSLKAKLGDWNIAAPQRRITIVETLMIGPRQRLFIVRRDNVEHLVMSTPEGATVIESGIPAPAKTETATP